VSGETVDLRSPLPEELRGALAAVAASSLSPTVIDPLDFFGFYRTDP
jgi:hypothetical protein